MVCDLRRTSWDVICNKDVRWMYNLNNILLVELFLVTLQLCGVLD